MYLQNLNNKTLLVVAKEKTEDSTYNNSNGKTLLSERSQSSWLCLEIQQGSVGVLENWSIGMKTEDYDVFLFCF